MFAAVVAADGLVAAAAALMDRTSYESIGWAFLLFAIGVGFALVVVRAPRARGPISVVALGSAIGGALAGAVLALLVLASHARAASAAHVGWAFALALAALCFAPVCALPLAPVLVVAARAIRAPSHDGPSVVLTVAGAWSAFVAVAAGLHGRNALALPIALAGAALALAGLRGRARLATRLARIRAGEAPGLAIVPDAEGAALDGIDRVLPLLRGGDGADAPAWIVRADASTDYRAAPARTALARVSAVASPPPSLLRAAFAGARPTGGELAGLLAWGVGVVALAWLAVMASLR